MKANAKDFPPLPRAQMHILLALADGERHGYAIMREVEAETAGRIKLGPGTLYGAIKTLLGEKLIVETELRRDPKMNGERRRYYNLSELGRRVLSAELRSLASVVALGRKRHVMGQIAPITP
jgi:DNA-binding PadR family transcriptional regulator